MENKLPKIKSCRLQFTDSANFMASSLSNLVNDLAERIHKIKYKNEIAVDAETSFDSNYELNR